jgi:hypothetical protein
VKRAIATGDIVPLRRGVYALGKRYRHQQFNLFELANKIYAPSYVSLESALSYHGWIPEAAYTVTSVALKRSKTFETPAGLFSYTRISRFNFVGVERIVQGNSIFLIASPTKAFVDYIFANKMETKRIADLANSLRIEPEQMRQISPDLIATLEKLYRSRRVTQFARMLSREVWR